MNQRERLVVPLSSISQSQRPKAMDGSSGPSDKIYHEVQNAQCPLAPIPKREDITVDWQVS